MICTNCNKDDCLDQDFSNLSLKAVNILCSEWLCDECMDEREAIDAAMAEQQRAGGE